MADDSVHELADVAFRSKNYEKAYDYYTKILEDDPKNGEAWARKGIAAGGLWTLDDDRFEELSACLKKAQEKGYDIKTEEVADRILELSKSYIERIYSHFDSKLQEKEQEAMGTGTLESVREFEVQTEGFVVGGDLVPEWFKAIETMSYACGLAPSIERYRETIRQIDELVTHSKGYQDFFQDHEVAEQYYDPLMSIRSDLVKDASGIDPDFQPDHVETANSGCYVATATVGRSDHRILDALRKFRDRHLLTHPIGRTVVSAYYVVGPYLAQIVKKSEVLRIMSRELLVNPLYKYAEWYMEKGR